MRYRSVRGIKTTSHYYEEEIGLIPHLTVWDEGDFVYTGLIDTDGNDIGRFKDRIGFLDFDGGS